MLTLKKGGGEWGGGVEQYLQSFSKVVRTPAVFNHNSIYSAFFKEYASPPPINVRFRIRKVCIVYTACI